MHINPRETATKHGSDQEVIHAGAAPRAAGKWHSVVSILNSTVEQGRCMPLGITVFVTFIRFDLASALFTIHLKKPVADRFSYLQACLPHHNS